MKSINNFFKIMIINHDNTPEIDIININKEYTSLFEYWFEYLKKYPNLKLSDNDITNNKIAINLTLLGKIVMIDTTEQESNITKVTIFLPHDPNNRQLYNLGLINELLKDFDSIELIDNIRKDGSLYKHHAHLVKEKNANKIIFDYIDTKDQAHSKKEKILG